MQRFPPRAAAVLVPIADEDAVKQRVDIVEHGDVVGGCAEERRGGDAGCGGGEVGGGGDGEKVLACCCCCAIGWCDGHFFLSRLLISFSYDGIQRLGHEEAASTQR